MKIKKTLKEVLEYAVSVVLLLAFTSCNVATPQSNTSVTSTTVKTVVAKSIDQQMDYIKPRLEPDLQAKIDNTGKAGQSLNGEQIVDLTISEEKGSDYIDFCYDVTTFHSNDNPESVLEGARPLMSEQEYNNLCQNAKLIEKSIMDFGEANEKAIRADQKEAYYKDLKSLVTKTVVMMTAGIVYAVIPDTVLWGKVSAAAAIAVGAGLVANIVMSIYQKYKVNDSTYNAYTIGQWLDELIKEPKAEYAISAAAFATASTVTENQVARGIIVCIFGLSQSLSIFQEIGKKYNFNL